MKKSLIALFLCLGLLLSGHSTALATLITSGTITFDGTESLTSTLRVLRNGIPSTWAAPKSFPGTYPLNPTFWQTVSLIPGTLEFVSITYNLISGDNYNQFLTTYLDSFDVNNLAANYLGDAGSSPPPEQGVQVFVPEGKTLILAFSTVYPEYFGTYSYSVEGYENNPVPEPATMLLLGSGLLGLAGFRRKFRKG